MNPTHADIIKQQVERFRNSFVIRSQAGTGFLRYTEADAFEDFLITAMHAAAQATEKAGEVEERDTSALDDNGREHPYSDGFNANCAEFRRQLDEYFGRNV